MAGRHWHYVYYSYEQGGRGYIGKRSSMVPPVEDPYLGSFTDKAFKPTHKVVIAIFENIEDAMRAEIALHRLFKVDKAEHFANKKIHSSPRFYWISGRKKQDGTIRRKKQDERDYSLSAKIVEMEKQFGPGDYADLERQLNLINKQSQSLIAEGETDNLITMVLLQNPGGLVIPVADLSRFCQVFKLNKDQIDLVLSGKLDNWEGWRSPVF